jgi:hypothetical protein
LSKGQAFDILKVKGIGLVTGEQQIRPWQTGVLAIARWAGGIVRH